MRLEFREVSLDFDGVRALRSLRAHLDGNVIGLLGANGSGKTSVLKLLAGVQAPTAGGIFIDGQEAVPGRRSGISYLPQETGFFPFLQHPARTLSLSMQFRGISDPDAPRRVLAALGLDEEERSAAGFSGGMKQKLRIAQALIHTPRLLLLDEPTTGLDSRERFRVLRLIDRLRGRVAVVFSTHQPDDAAAVCDTVLILVRGRAVAWGSPHDLTRLAEGHVHDVMVTGDRVPEFEGAEVIEVEPQEGRRRLRVVGAAPPGATPVPPRLEDAYVLLTMTEADGDESEDGD